MSSDQNASSINFFSEEIDFELTSESSFEHWVDKIATENKASIENLNYIFCNDSYLLKVNQEYLDHDYYTDIISFPYSEFPDPLEGDIFISVDRVRENAKDNGVQFDNELKRVMAHGILHFLGYKDKSESEAAIMRKKEEEMIALFKDA